MTTTEVTIDRRADSHKAIQRLIDHRTEMLTLYSELATHRPFKETPQIIELLQRFCQSLIDYTADAHLRLYQFIENNNERRVSMLSVAKRIYPRIADATDTILDFNDLYDSLEQCKDLHKLENELSKLGEILADRIELEDQLINVIRSPRDEDEDVQSE